MSLPFPFSPGVRCQMSIHYVWVTVLNQGRTCHSRAPTQTAAMDSTSRSRKSLDSQWVLWFESSDNYSKLDIKEVTALISVNQNCQSVAGEVAGTFLRGMHVSLLPLRLIFLSHSQCCKATKLIWSRSRCDSIVPMFSTLLHLWLGAVSSRAHSGQPCHMALRSELGSQGTPN